MLYPEPDFAQSYAIGPSNGTRAVSEFRLGTESTLIGIESVAMMAGPPSLKAAPSPVLPPRERQARSAVRASLERSLSENADVWAELSKH